MDGVDYEIIPLTELIIRFGEEKVAQSLKRYKGVFDSATESYLHDKAIEMEKRDISRTYMAVDTDMNILGYVTIGIKCAMFDSDDDSTKEISEKIRHRMNIDMKNDVAQSYLLGQLSRSPDAPKGFGETLVGMAIRELLESKRIVGCRMVRLDCHDELIPYYERLGFKYIRKNADGTLNQMVTFI